ncbi:hypothetical protein SLH46_12810 [Draconibacterium sp. IB214405]|uniref:hypothetical protein n=1 Tax=Draconibacterium sp. IB214405 TaxID=3097352 RepID=UPI002A0D0A29|nr:hypothetical protein [Draconibacterium sp. IB214405]MDX8340074.1 hypothetical protein [Draconibacterium sp. IB214405]
MKAKLLFGMFIIMSTIFWSCMDVDLVNPKEETNSLETNLIASETNLKSGSAEKQISLQLKNEKSSGTVTISNTSTTLTVKFKGNSTYDLEEVQLWVGTTPDAVPSNSQNIPTPGRFPYKSAGKTEYQFTISQNEITPGYDFEEGGNIYLFAHASAVNKSTGTKESAWSTGEYISDKPNFAASYSTYTPVGGGGCFPHVAFCGLLIENTYYYDINNESESIVADNGQIIGTASYIDQNIRFYFDQDWMFSDNTTLVVIKGYQKPGGKAFEVYSGKPLAPSPPMFYYYGPLTKYNYYSVELNVQYCTTDN